MPGLFGSKESGFSGGGSGGLTGPKFKGSAGLPTADGLAADTATEGPVDDREAALQSTALRWVRPLEPRPTIDAPLYGPETDGSLEASLDAFMDRYLPWMPVPRYSAASRPTEGLTDDDVLGALIEMTEIFTSHGPEAALGSLDGFYDYERAALQMLPLIDTLRSPDTTVETAAALCILTALDPKTAAALSESAIVQSDFAVKAQKLISRELGRQFGSLQEAISGAHAYLQKKAIQLAETNLPKAEASWQLLADAEARYYMPHKAAIEKSIAEYAQQTGLSVEYLRSRCRIQNLVAEDLVMGF